MGNGLRKMGGELWVKLRYGQSLPSVLQFHLFALLLPAHSKI